MQKKIILLFLLFQVSSFLSQDLETTLQEIADDFGVMGMSLYVNVNGTVSETYIGHRDYTRNLPVNENTQYRIASVSKSFTALGLIKLINDGAIGLDDDISEVLDYELRNPNFLNIPITCRMLLSHTSSLQDGSGYAPFLDATYNQSPIPNISELLLASGSNYTANMWRQEIPGTYFTYSNINYGLIGTLIEVLSGQRFDIFMREQILIPLEIDGSFNIQDLIDINNVSVLYRYNNGWEAQWDNYQGIMPIAPNLNDYILGTNGIYFAPQGGLRITAREMNSIARALASDGAFYNLNITEENYQLMKAIAWDYNGSNGDNYGGLFNRWALGLHHANLSTSDTICIAISEIFIGHPGEAYGLISDNYFIEGSDVSFSFLINGVQLGYQVGTAAFYTIEEDIFEAICMRINQILNQVTFNDINFEIIPNPAKSYITITLPSELSNSEIGLLDIKGKTIKNIRTENKESIDLMLLGISKGVYFIQVNDGEKSSIKKLIVE
ncbi:serine hydrolase [Flavobacteriaceae bacterium]|nr:serine hydrolase [Flavobacteriaceae bacterium]MDA9025667.1 serine hydrolase [bacterium]